MARFVNIGGDSFSRRLINIDLVESITEENAHSCRIYFASSAGYVTSGDDELCLYMGVSMSFAALMKRLQDPSNMLVI